MPRTWGLQSEEEEEEEEDGGARYSAVTFWNSAAGTKSMRDAFNARTSAMVVARCRVAHALPLAAEAGEEEEGRGGERWQEEGWMRSTRKPIYIAGSRIQPNGI
jgi:hypothetical protein